MIITGGKQNEEQISEVVFGCCCHINCARVITEFRWNDGARSGEADENVLLSLVLLVRISRRNTWVKNGRFFEIFPGVAGLRRIRRAEDYALIVNVLSAVAETAYVECLLNIGCYAET